MTSHISNILQSRASYYNKSQVQANCTLRYLTFSKLNLLSLIKLFIPKFTLIKSYTLKCYSFQKIDFFKDLCFVNLKRNYFKADQKISAANRTEMSKKPTDIMSLILGNQKTNDKKQQKNIQKLNRELIISSAMFWDSKRRIQKIKTLFLNNIGLKEFDDTQDFKVEELESIELLSLSKNQVIHMHPISHLSSLISLNVSFNRIYDLNPLQKLTKLQQLYASNNQIKTIDPLRELNCLKVLQLYHNKIHHFKQSYETLSSLSMLVELDIEANPVAQDPEFIRLISSTLSSLKKINGELNKSSQKIKQMSSSNGFINSKGFMSNTSMNSFGFTSMAFTANSSKIIDPQRTFYDFCKKKSSVSNTWQKKLQKQNILQKLQLHYNELDDQFQRQIVKNVRLKNKLYKIMQNAKQIASKKQDNSAKIQQTKLLKRKVAAIKQQLFAKTKKGELLKRLFEIQLTQKTIQNTKNTNQGRSDDLQDNLGMQRLQQSKNQIRWSRKFEADEIIVVQRKKHTQVQTQEEQIQSLLGKFQSSIRQMKSDMDYLS